MNQAIMILIALGALLGGIDRILGNRFGLGEKFEEGFRLMGSVGLSMAGIICLTPVISTVLGGAVTKLFTSIGVDPGMFGGILAIDMGGYQLAMGLTKDPAVGRFAGIIVSAIFGCTVVFTIPVGMETAGESGRPLFSRGLLMGLIAMPVALLLGGVLCGLGLWNTVRQCLPVFIVSALLLVGLVKWPKQLVRGFSGFAKLIQIVCTIGLTLGAIQYMTGWNLLPGLAPLEDAMVTVSAIAIVLLGSLPLAELVRRLLQKPFAWIGKRTGLNDVSTTGLLIGAVSVTPALVMMKDMDDRGKVVNAASLVCAASCFSAHIGFTLSAEPELLTPLVAAKLTGGILSVAIAMLATRKKSA